MTPKLKHYQKHSNVHFTRDDGRQLPRGETSGKAQKPIGESGESQGLPILHGLVTHPRRLRSVHDQGRFKKGEETIPAL